MMTKLKINPMELRPLLHGAKLKKLGLGLLVFSFLLFNFELAPWSTGPQLHGAVGDVVADCQSVASAAVLDIQPGAGVEWIIHNIGFTHEVELQRWDGTDVAAMVTFSGPGWQHFFPGFHVNNTQRIRVKNNDASSRVICYDGVQTK